jgi:hypothetical protein
MGKHPTHVHVLLSKHVLQAWIEASTKGGVLLFTASEVETVSLAAGINPGFAGLLGGMTGGITQAYATMGEYCAPPNDSPAFVYSLSTCRNHNLYENCRNHATKNFS